MSKETAERLLGLFIDHCKNKGYQTTPSEKAHNLRLEISNLKERTIVNIYFTGKIDIQGQKNALKDEMEALKNKIELTPEAFAVTTDVKACTQRYDIMLPDMRGKIKESLNSVEAYTEITDSPKENIEYRAKLTRNGSSLTMTQFDNGTLLLQGKSDKLFNDSCDMIEKVANPSDKEVIARFISSNEESLSQFTAKYTPELLSLAESNVKAKIGKVYDYLEPYDKKWFVAAECLSLTRIPLPEYSPVVMPASKAFEGFAKKLLIGIGLYDLNYFKSKNANLRKELMNKDNPNRKAICGKDKHCETFLKNLDVSIDMYRNFMMHSDESVVTKVESPEEAESKLTDIYKSSKEIFDYFNEHFKLIPA